MRLNIPLTCADANLVAVSLTQPPNAHREEAQGWQGDISTTMTREAMFCGISQTMEDANIEAESLIDADKHIAASVRAEFSTL